METQATPPPRKFTYAMPQRWRNKESGKDLKVIPWFQPIDDQSRWDLKGLLGEVMPELSDDVMASFEVYSGLVIQVGWLVENENRMWLGLAGLDMRNHFTELGDWKDEKPNTTTNND